MFHIAGIFYKHVWGAHVNMDGMCVWWCVCVSVCANINMNRLTKRYESFSCAHNPWIILHIILCSRIKLWNTYILCQEYGSKATLKHSQFPFHSMPSHFGCELKMKGRIFFFVFFLRRILFDNSKHDLTDSENEICTFLYYRSITSWNTNAVNRRITLNELVCNLNLGIIHPCIECINEESERSKKRERDKHEKGVYQMTFLILNLQHSRRTFIMCQCFLFCISEVLLCDLGMEEWSIIYTWRKKRKKESEFGLCSAMWC